mmetsp:Transcript_6397/g.27182  ORF Transcript_6397/g.27182 Transcript_6397/m.27182 type:complete len:320 (-) Transcript_6397:2806-3765(-)
MTENGLNWNGAVRFVLSRLGELNGDRKGFTVEECTGEILRLTDSEQEKFGLLEKLRANGVNKSVESMVSTALVEVADAVAESGDRTLYQARSPLKKSTDNDHCAEDNTATAPQHQKRSVSNPKDKENVESAIISTSETDVKNENDAGKAKQAPVSEAKPEPKQKKKKAISTIKRDNSSTDKDHPPQTKSAAKKKNNVSSSKSEESFPKKRSGRKPTSSVENNVTSSDRAQSPDTKTPRKKSSPSAENHTSSTQKSQSIDTKKTKKKVRGAARESIPGCVGHVKFHVNGRNGLPPSTPARSLPLVDLRGVPGHPRKLVNL